MKITYRRCWVCHRRRRFITVARDNWTTTQCSKGHRRRWRTPDTVRMNLIFKKVYLPVILEQMKKESSLFKLLSHDKPSVSGGPFTFPISLSRPSPSEPSTALGQ